MQAAKKLDTDFRSQFAFDLRKIQHVGIEQECFIVDESGAIVPKAVQVLARARELKWIASPHAFELHGSSHIEPGSRIGYELSACQVETRIDATPVVSGDQRMSRVYDELSANARSLKRCLASLGLSASYCEVAPDDMPLDVFPDPSGRYQQIVQTMPRHVLLAACQIIGTHVHYGVRDHESALRVYNHARKHAPRLTRLGDNSFGKRMQVYSIVKPNNEPPEYGSWDDFYDDARENGFDTDPRSNWRTVRITKHGTIEFRMFGATESIETVAQWASECYDVCSEAL